VISKNKKLAAPESNKMAREAPSSILSKTRTDLHRKLVEAVLAACQVTQLHIILQVGAESKPTFARAGKEMNAKMHATFRFRSFIHSGRSFFPTWLTESVWQYPKLINCLHPFLDPYFLWVSDIKIAALLDDLWKL
jgi:hypothetical protein